MDKKRAKQALEPLFDTFCIDHRREGKKGPGVTGCFVRVLSVVHQKQKYRRTQIHFRKDSGKTVETFSEQPRLLCPQPPDASQEADRGDLL
jgi:hypothetical protein